MAKSNRGTAVSRYNMIATYGSGKAGNVRLYQKGDKTYIRAAYNSSVTNPRTDDQMKRRLKFANMSKMWRLLAPYLQQAFDGTSASVSTFNLFMRANRDNGIYLTKDQTYKGMQITQPIVVAAGSLSDVTSEIVLDGAQYKLTSPTLKTSAEGDYPHYATIGEMSRDLIEKNPTILKDGDKITAISIRQMPIPIGGVAKVAVSADSITLDVNSEESFPINYMWGRYTSGANNYLYYYNSAALTSNSSAAIIISRREDGRLKTSNSVTDANDNTYQNYLTRNAFDLARASYGEGKEVFLNPDKVPAPEGYVNITLKGDAGGHPEYVKVWVGNAGMDTIPDTQNEITVSVRRGAELTINAFPTEAGEDASYTTFIKWEENNDINNPTTITATEDATYTAKYQAGY